MGSQPVICRENNKKMKINISEIKEKIPSSKLADSTMPSMYFLVIPGHDSHLYSAERSLERTHAHSNDAVPMKSSDEPSSCSAKRTKGRKRKNRGAGEGLRVESKHERKYSI